MCCSSRWWSSCDQVHKVCRPTRFDGRQVLTDLTRLHGVKPDIYAEGTHFNVRMREYEGDMG